MTSSEPLETVNWVTSRTAIAAVSETSHLRGVVPSAAYSAGILVGFGLRLVDIGVDPGDVVEEVGVRLLALGAEALRRAR